MSGKNPNYLGLVYIGASRTGFVNDTPASEVEAALRALTSHREKPTPLETPTPDSTDPATE